MSHDHNATDPITFSIIHALGERKVQIIEHAPLLIPVWPSVETELFQKVRYTGAHQISSCHNPWVIIWLEIDLDIKKDLTLRSNSTTYLPHSDVPVLSCREILFHCDLLLIPKSLVFVVQMKREPCTSLTLIFQSCNNPPTSSPMTVPRQVNS